MLMGMVACLAAQAAIVPSLSLPQLIEGSEIIVHGRVGRSWAAWDGDHKYVWTHYAIEVIDPIRGSGMAPVVVSEPGGKLDGIEMRFSGVSPYAAGEEVVLFLYRTPIGYLRTVGNVQGKYTVTSGTKAREFKARVREKLK
jgi:hypothetical protein